MNKTFHKEDFNEIKEPPLLLRHDQLQDSLAQLHNTKSFSQKNSLILDNRRETMDSDKKLLYSALSFTNDATRNINIYSRLKDTKESINKVDSKRMMS